MTENDVVAVERVERHCLVKDGAGAGEHGVPGAEEAFSAKIHDRKIAVLEVDERAKVLDPEDGEERGKDSRKGVRNVLWAH